MLMLMLMRWMTGVRCVLANNNNRENKKKWKGEKNGVVVTH